MRGQSNQSVQRQLLAQLGLGAVVGCAAYGSALLLAPFVATALLNRALSSGPSGGVGGAILIVGCICGVLLGGLVAGCIVRGLASSAVGSPFAASASALVGLYIGGLSAAAMGLGRAGILGPLRSPLAPAGAIVGAVVAALCTRRRSQGRRADRRAVAGGFLARCAAYATLAVAAAVLSAACFVPFALVGALGVGPREWRVIMLGLVFAGLVGGGLAPRVAEVVWGANFARWPVAVGTAVGTLAWPGLVALLSQILGGMHHELGALTLLGVCAGVGALVGSCCNR